MYIYRYASYVRLLHGTTATEDGRVARGADGGTLDFGETRACASRQSAIVVAVVYRV